MIRGRFDEQGQPTLPVQLSGLHGTVEVILVVDTGFDGDICVPIPVAITLGLPLKGFDFVELADGSIHKEFFFQGNAQLGGLPTCEVEVYLTESEQGLIGAGMFQHQKLEIDYEHETVTLKPVRRATTRRR